MYIQREDNPNCDIFHSCLHWFSFFTSVNYTKNFNDSITKVQISMTSCKIYAENSFSGWS